LAKKIKSQSGSGKRWVCPSCKNRAKTAFCAACGESRPEDHHLASGHLFKQLVHAFTSVDGRLLRSLRYLIAHPGVLTTAYMHGRRILYLGPFQLFLAANVLFFAVQSLTNTNIVSTPLDSHLHVQDWGPTAQALVAQKLDANGMTLAAYAPLFDQAIIFYGKLFIILMVAPFSLLLWLTSLRHKRPAATHIVFSLHFYTFLLLLFCVSLTAAEISLLLGGKGLSSVFLDNSLTLFNLVVCSFYLYAAIGVVYGSRKFTRVIKSIFLGVSVTAILLGYRFLLFIFTLYIT